jgi:Ca2+-binding EF-hand superfamily protein
MSSIDTDNDGVISIDEFKTFTKEQDVKLLKVFNEIDKDGSGKLNIQEVS